MRHNTFHQRIKDEADELPGDHDAAECAVFVPAGDVEIGDWLYVDGSEIGDEPGRVTGWFYDGNGRMVLEVGDRFHSYSRFLKVRINREAR